MSEEDATKIIHEHFEKAENCPVCAALEIAKHYAGAGKTVAETSQFIVGLVAFFSGGERRKSLSTDPKAFQGIMGR